MVLLLTLDTFSRTGGIQQFNRCLQLALCHWAGEHAEQVTHLSLHDDTGQQDRNYAWGEHFHFRGFGNSRLAYIRAAVAEGGRSHTIIFGHVNLLYLALWPAFRKKRMLLAAHGIEVWQPLTGLKQNGLRRMDNVLAVSSYTAAKLQEVQGLSPERIVLFPNTLDPVFAATPLLPAAQWNRNWRINPGGTYLLTVARLSHTEGAKGYDDVIRALPALVEQVPDLAYILAGKADDAEYERIRKLAADLGVDNRLLMPGFVPASHLPSLYNLAKVFVLPSTKEGFGIVFLEAAWWGCRLVALNSGGVPDALLNGQLGLLVKPGDNHALATAIRDALLLPYQKDSALTTNRSLIESHFGFGLFCSRLSAVLSEP